MKRLQSCRRRRNAPLVRAESCKIFHSNSALPARESRSVCLRNRCQLLFRLFRQESVQLRNHLKRICYVQHVGFAPSPSAVRIQIDGATLIDEAPSYNVRFFPMTTCGEPLWVARRGSGLADLVEMGHESEDCLIVSGLINQRLASAE